MTINDNSQGNDNGRDNKPAFKKICNFKKPFIYCKYFENSWDG